MLEQEMKEMVNKPNEPFSPLSGLFFELNSIENEKTFLYKTIKKSKNLKKKFIILNEINKHRQKANFIKKHISSLLKEAKNDESILLGLLEAKNIKIGQVSKLLEKYGLIYNSKPHSLLTQVEKMIIRADYSGSLSPINDETMLSELYLECKKNKKPLAYDYKDYSNLTNSKAWTLFSQFKNFRNLETFVKKHLYSIGYPPTKIKKLVVEDFIDIFNKEQQRKGNHLFLGAKKSFIKNFIKKSEPQFKQILRSLDVDEKYITALVVSMKTKGFCDRIRVYDKKGKLIEGPSFSVHHKIAVQDGNCQNNLAEVNLFKNLCLTINEPYHSKILHRLDRTLVTNDGKITQKRIEFRDKNIIFMGGLSPLHQISYDYENDKRTKRKIQQINQVPRVNVKMKSKPTSQVLDVYENQMKKQDKRPIDFRTYMKIREDQSKH